MVLFDVMVLMKLYFTDADHFIFSVRCFWLQNNEVIFGRIGPVDAMEWQR